MTLQIEDYIRKVKPVKAVRVTEDNIDEVAKWCGGLHIPAPGLAGENNKLPYIHVAVYNPRDKGDTQAFPGMWVIREDFRRYRIYDGKRFKNSHDKIEPRVSVPTPKQVMPAKKTEPTPEPAKPVQVGAVEVVPGTPPDEGSSLTTGTTKTVHRSAESGEFVTEAVADANPATTVEETVSINGNELSAEETALLAEMEAEEAAEAAKPKLGEHDGRTTVAEIIEKEDSMNEQNELGTVEADSDDIQADELIDSFDRPGPDDVVPGDMHDATQPEADEDGTVQLGVPVEDVDLESSDDSEVPSLCGQCGTETVDGVCSKDTDHNIYGTAEQAEPDALPGD